MYYLVPIKNSIKRGEIYWVNLSIYEAKGSEQLGFRPALVIQNNIANGITNTVIIALISTFKRKKGRRIPTHVLIKKGLPTLSVIMLEQLHYVDQSVIETKICTLDEFQMQKVNDRLRNSVGLSCAFKA